MKLVVDLPLLFNDRNAQSSPFIPIGLRKVIHLSVETCLGCVPSTLKFMGHNGIDLCHCHGI